MKKTIKKQKNNMVRKNISQKIIDFIKYHNAFTIGLILIFVFSGAIFASEDVKKAVIGEEIITQTGIENTQLLEADLDNFDLAMTIEAVSEDESNYYIDYSFNTLGIKENVWQPLIRKVTMTVSKLAIQGKDLGLYLTEELGEAADYQIKFLQEVQKAEREKGETKIVETAEYTGLIGLVLNTKEKVLPGYEPVIEPEVVVFEPRNTTPAQLPEPEPQLESQPQSEPEPEPELFEAAEPEPTEPESESELEPEPEPEPEPESQPEEPVTPPEIPPIKTTTLPKDGVELGN